jgi:hypothetical protein
MKARLQYEWKNLFRYMRSREVEEGKVRVETFMKALSTYDLHLTREQVGILLNETGSTPVSVYYERMGEVLALVNPPKKIAKDDTELLMSARNAKATDHFKLFTGEVAKMK